MVILNARIIVGSGTVMGAGTLVVRGGRIRSVGNADGYWNALNAVVVITGGHIVVDKRASRR